MCKCNNTGKDHLSVNRTDHWYAQTAHFPVTLERTEAGNKVPGGFPNHHDQSGDPPHLYRLFSHAILTSDELDAVREGDEGAIVLNEHWLCCGACQCIRVIDAIEKGVDPETLEPPLWVKALHNDADEWKHVQSDAHILAVARLAAIKGGLWPLYIAAVWDMAPRCSADTAA